MHTHTHTHTCVTKTSACVDAHASCQVDAHVVESRGGKDVQESLKPLTGAAAALFTPALADTAKVHMQSVQAVP